MSRRALTSLLQSSNSASFSKNITAVRRFHRTMDLRAKLQPAARVAGQKQDVWYVSEDVQDLKQRLMLTQI